MGSEMCIRDSSWRFLEATSANHRKPQTSANLRKPPIWRFAEVSRGFRAEVFGGFRRFPEVCRGLRRVEEGGLQRFAQYTASCAAPPRRKFSNRPTMRAGASKTRFPVLIVVNVNIMRLATEIEFAKGFYLSSACNVSQLQCDYSVQCNVNV